MGKRFRVGFFFAGEKRDFVAEVAEILAQKFGRDSILYDKYLEAELARGDLVFHLPNLYVKDTDLVVGLFCGEYKKNWCGLEWRAINALLKDEQYEAVMLTRFDCVEPEGLYGLAVFIDLDDKTSERFAELILERLARNEGKPTDFYKTNSGQQQSSSPQAGWRSASLMEWPDVHPPMTWRMANHHQVQVAFSKLISHSEQGQLLLIKGKSEMGKSHLSKQFFANALKIAGLRCGRFDFNGTEDLDGELRAFAYHLEVAFPTQESISNCLAQILYYLKEKPRPTLLIFDTFEAAGEARNWFEKMLLPSLIRSPWLRVALLGQPPLINGNGEIWEECSLPPIQLNQPTPEDWFAYGKSYNSDLDPVSVSLAYSSCNGKSSLLAQFLGPSS